MLRFLKLVSCLALLPFGVTFALAQDTSGKTILVLDASGSMWGQIDGITKIEIAQSVIGELLKDIPDEQELGLTVYGHNRKGDCSDIETLVTPSTGTKNAISKAVNAIKPKGKTPLSEAVITAAEALKFTENKATVILISDGRETCDFDPCEVGKRLEESGVDFTAHVVGFDVANPADRAQLQCLAENTGGEFLTASNASELTNALQKVSASPAPEPRDITFNAIEEGTTNRVRENLIWTLTNIETGEILVNLEGMEQINASLLPSKYKAEVLRSTDEAIGELTVTISKNTSTTFHVELPPYLPQATLDGPTEAPVGADITVGWTGPNEKSDLITIAKVGDKPARYLAYVYTHKGSPAMLRMPAEPGEYELRYWLREGNKVLASSQITASPVSATLEAEDTASAGDNLVVNWTGPDYKSDYISIAKIGDKGGRYEKYTYTQKGSPLRLQMPAEAGDYELRYIMGLKSTVLATLPITVTDISASLTAPDVATVGESIIVEWQGPDYKNDYIDVAEPTPVATKQTRHINYTYTNKGSPLRLQMPAEPGDYVIRYVMSQDAKIIAKHNIRVEAVSVSITAPDIAKIGEPLIVEWVGPDYDNDYIDVAKPTPVATKQTRHINYTYTNQGSPLRLKMPLDPGEYEIRYILNQDSKIKAKKTITVEPLTVTLDFNSTAKIAEPLLISWDGPDYKNDYIAVSEKGGDGKYINYTYTNQGTPLRVVMPAKPGEYEIRYFANGSSDKILARKSVMVETVDATVQLAGDALTGEEALIEWTGPDYKSDYIAVSEIGTDKYINYNYTKNGSPLRLKMPDKPGSYELRYFMNEDRTIIARQQIDVQ